MNAPIAFTRSLCFAVGLLSLAIAAGQALAEYRLGGIVVDQAYARATAPKAPTGAAYVSVANTGAGGDRLVGAASPRASTVELHTMSMEGDIMRMRPIEGVDLPPGGRLAMQPGGGVHIMLIGLTAPLKPGDRFPLTLEFAKAGKLEVSVEVRALGAGSPAGGAPVAKQP